MSKLYKDLSDIIDFKPDKDEEALCEHNMKKVKVASDIIISAVILLGIVAIFCIYAKIQWGIYGFIVFSVVSLIFFQCYQRKYGVRVNSLLNDKCDVNKAFTAYMVMARYYVRKTPKVGALLSCIAGTLFYLGNFEEAKKVLDLICKYCDTPEGNAYRVSLYAMIKAQEKDKEAVAFYVKELETLMSQANSPYMTTSYNTISKYHLIMEAGETGDYAKATELLQTDEKASVLKRVNINYRLYKVAKVAGMEAEAAKHRAYVIEKGGDTFYKKELENVN